MQTRFVTREHPLETQNSTNRTKRLAGMLGFLCCVALPGLTTYGQPSVSVGVAMPLPGVQIRAESDFYEPLTPYGQ